MRRTKWVAALLVVAAAITVLVSCHPRNGSQSQTPKVGGSISGHVYGLDGVTPIANASVSVSGVAGTGSGSTQTGTDGSYTITGLPSGSYRLSTQAGGYIQQYYNGAYDSSGATLVAVTQRNDTPNIDFAMVPYGWSRGPADAPVVIETFIDFT